MRNIKYKNTYFSLLPAQQPSWATIISVCVFANQDKHLYFRGGGKSSLP